MSFLVNIPYLEEQDVGENGSLSPEVGKGKPVILMIQGNYCGYCTQAKPEFQKFATECKNAVACTIQIDDAGTGKNAMKKLASVNNSLGIPTFLGFDSSGK